MTEPLLQGVNHVALASPDVDATAAFYAEVFGLEITDVTEPGSYRNVLLFFPNGSFVQVLGATDGQITDIAGLVRNLGFKDPDGRNVDVTAYI